MILLLVDQSCIFFRVFVAELRQSCLTKLQELPGNFSYEKQFNTLEYPSILLKKTILI